jgi:FkbM family methyltransferase
MNIKDLFANADRPAIEKWCRAQTQVAYVGENRALCRVLGTFMMYVDTRDLSLAPHMMLNGFWEMWVTQAIVDYVKPGMRCIDVGANVGYYTLLLAELAGAARVSALEPQVRLVPLLNSTLHVNGLTEVEVFKRAVSNRSDLTKFYVADALLGSASLNQGGGLFDQGGMIQTTTLDEVFRDAQRYPSFDFVKIDVQGHELQVLEGMKELLARSPKIAIAMEFTPGEHESPAGSLESILAMGLRIQAIGTDGQVRPLSMTDAARADTGDHRMLWLTRA